MRKILACLTVLCVMLAGVVVAQTTSGIISSDETWSGTLTVTGDVLVTGGTLTISPGTVVKFAMSNDNIVEGGSSAIWLVITQGGGIKAEGTAASPITFTTSSLTPAAGNWGRVEVKGLTSSTTLSFKYCIMEYADVGIEFRDNVAISPIIDHCTFRNFAMSGTYATSGCDLTYSYCTIHDMGSAGIFMHGTGAININYCTIYNSPTGIINAGDAAYPQQSMAINHITMYNIDMMMSSNPKWWTGYGFYSCNEVGNGSIKNSILVQSTLANMKINGWNIDHNYNCWHTGMLGLMNIEDGTPGANSFEADPLFANAAGGDFSLLPGSPAINAADDGSNMGAWGSGAVNDSWNKAMRNKGMTISDMPVVKEFAIDLGQPVNAMLDIYDVSGNVLRTVSGTQVSRIAWDCRSAGGSKVAPGIYLFKMQAGKDLVQGNIVVAH